MTENSYCKDPYKESAIMVADFLMNGYTQLVAVTLPGRKRYYSLRHRLNGNFITITANSKAVTVVKNGKTVKTVTASPLT